MAYTKTNWVNDQTKLNATNMNHIEDGIEDLDLNKQDKLTAGTNITITSDNIISATGEPTNYLKSASVANEVLTITKKDDTTVSLDISTKANTSALTDEASTRQAADTVLTNGLNNEAATRENADNVLSTAIGTKQDKLTAGDNINIDSDNKISVTGVVTDVKVNNTSVKSGTTANINYRTDLSTDDLNAPTTTAVRAFVNSSITASAANYVTSDAAGDNFATKAALLAATTFYNSGVVYSPKKNDYAIVAADEDHSNAQARYINTSETVGTPSWSYQYTVGSAFTAAQQAAIDSGVNSTKVGNYDSHISNTSNPHSVTASQVGLGNVNNTSDLNKPISTATQTALNAKQNTLTAGTNISIIGSTISATDTTYTAGSGITISGTTIISNIQFEEELDDPSSPLVGTGQAGYMIIE